MRIAKWIFQIEKSFLHNCCYASSLCKIAHWQLEIKLRKKEFEITGLFFKLDVILLLVRTTIETKNTQQKKRICVVELDKGSIFICTLFVHNSCLHWFFSRANIADNLLHKFIYFYMYSFFVDISFKYYTIPVPFYQI